jgi:two-component system, NtrC family, response regulator
MANDNTHQLIDPAILKNLREQGMEAEALRIEQRLGINIGAIANQLDKFVTVDPACLALKDAVYKLAPHEDTVLIQGDSGSGKELIARALGANRKAGRFVAINVSAIPRELVESTLFGYEKGAFTGAAVSTEGLIQYAGEGTLFLDEIGDLGLDLQSKFLRVLQDRMVRRVGSNKEEEVKCRFLAATHCDMRKLVDEKLFRLDLYARLATFVLRIPALSARPGDIAAILSSLNCKMPSDKVDWSKVDLSFGVRHLIQYARRYDVLGELPATK